MGERVEALLRIPLAFLYGVIAGVWGFIVGIGVIVHWFHAIILGRRHRGIAEFTNKFITYAYTIYRYLYFTTNERPWPIGKKGPSEIDPVDMRP